MIFSYDNFKNDSIKIYKDLIDENLKKSFDEISKKIDTEYKHNIGKNYNNTLYDYSEFNDIEIDGKKYNNEELKKFINNFAKLDCGNEMYKKLFKQNIIQFLNFRENEKVVICHTYINRVDRGYDSNRNHNFVNNDYYLMITNYGKIFNFYSNATWYAETNFWIPLDYIFIIKEILNVYVKVYEPPPQNFRSRGSIPEGSKLILYDNKDVGSIVERIFKLLVTIKNKYFNKINLLDHNNELEQNNKKIKKYNNDLEQYKIDLLEENKKIKKYNNDLEQDKIDLLKENNKLKVHNNDIEQYKIVLLEENNKLKVHNNDIGQENNKLKKYNNDIGQENNKLKKYNNDIEQDKIDLLEENNKLKVHNNDIGQENIKIKKHNNELEQNNKIKIIILCGFCILYFFNNIVLF